MGSSTKSKGGIKGKDGNASTGQSMKGASAMAKGGVMKAGKGGKC